MSDLLERRGRAGRGREVVLDLAVFGDFIDELLNQRQHIAPALGRPLGVFDETLEPLLDGGIFREIESAGNDTPAASYSRADR